MSVFLGWPLAEALRGLVCQVFGSHRNLLCSSERIKRQTSVLMNGLNPEKLKSSRILQTKETRHVNSKIILSENPVYWPALAKRFLANLNCEETITAILQLSMPRASYLSQCTKVIFVLKTSTDGVSLQNWGSGNFGVLWLLTNQI